MGTMPFIAFICRKGLTCWRARLWCDAALEVNYTEFPTISRKVANFRILQITVIPVSKSTKSKSGHHQSLYEKPSVVTDFYKIYAVYQVDEK